jgi:hypothetical protein
MKGALLLVAIAATALARGPCEDTTYLRLKAIPIDSLTAGAAVLFLAREQACKEAIADARREGEREQIRWEQEEKGKTAAALIVSGSLALIGALLIIFLNHRLSD